MIWRVTGWLASPQAEFAYEVLVTIFIISGLIIAYHLDK